jgi:hypothetical protein
MFYLQRNICTKVHITGDRQMVQLQNAGWAFEAAQEALDLIQSMANHLNKV